MKWIARIFIVLGALILSQMPLFISAYTQQLYGRVAELKMQKDELLKMAQASGKTLEQYIYKFLASTDPDFHGQGEWMQGTLNRLQSLSEALTSIQGATLWERPFIFLKTLNFEMAKTTFALFTPGLPLTAEGAAYIAAGAIFGWICFHAILLLFRPLRRKRAAPDT